MDTLPCTSIIAALLGLIMLPLTVQISVRRAALGKAVGDLARFTFGDADDGVLRRRRRAFGNFIEYTPTCLILLALAEAGGASPIFLWTVGLLLVTGRVVHALGMLYADSPLPRGFGMLMTYAAIAGPSLWLLYNASI